jgi:hydroxypyruvate reductase
MLRSAATLRADALAIWRAAVEAVRSDRLVRETVRVDGDRLVIGDEVLQLSSIGKIAVVGTGKAGAGMAAGLEAALGPEVLAAKQVGGWINVPADCLRELSRIHLHPARPAGVNEPTSEGVHGAERILELVGSLRSNDLCLCLISGGGSALLPAPVAGVSLGEKQALTRLLSAAGANIQELNTVRKQISRIKGGGLARACRGGRLISLIISDVLGDPLDVIASGPTVTDTATPRDALEVLARYAGSNEQVAPGAFAYLREQARSGAVLPPPSCQVTNLVIGNNALAVDAAGAQAERRGYSHAMDSATRLEGAAEDIGVHLAQMALRMRTASGPDCLITGGEPTVRLAPPELRGKGGRNQQLVLAGLIELFKARAAGGNPSAGIALLSGGTDGEDGPTDAAGAFFDADLLARMCERNLDPGDFLRRNDAYRFFEPLGGLIRTGPTHTNVCDVRVVVVDRIQTPPRTAS